MSTPPTYVPEFKNPCWYEYGNMSEPTLHCLPFFMILGQNKCGTSDLYPSILNHPDVIPARDKEPQFWARHRHCYCKYDYLPCFLLSWIFEIDSCGNLTYSFRCRRSKPWTLNQYVDFFKATAKKIKLLSESTIQTDNMHHTEFITGEASPSNLWDNRWWWNYDVNRYDTEPPALTNADYLRHFLPNLKMIIILRNPVTRLYSDYLYISTGKVSPQRFHQEVAKEINWFKDCIRYHDIRYCVFRNSFNEANVRSTARLQNGLYAVFIEEYMKLFPREQFHILRLEEYSKNKTGEMKKIFRFLNLRDSEVRFTFTRRNKGSRNKTDMLPETKALLTKFYKSYNVRLADLLRDRKFMWID
ncbi:carbohydrate sulfotransferase 15-like [Pecten maximus]|uniref:carbohydrate sulfotransferase 15-like n=1 Tax=Pecten maximus TaxID=6579 RepID=UPI0014581107|nr:carbohydrate sulfotransferase 15-like [Pecten maximus]